MLTLMCVGGGVGCGEGGDITYLGYHNRFSGDPLKEQLNDSLNK